MFSFFNDANRDDSDQLFESSDNFSYFKCLQEKHSQQVDLRFPLCNPSLFLRENKEVNLNHFSVCVEANSGQDSDAQFVQKIFSLANDDREHENRLHKDETSEARDLNGSQICASIAFLPNSGLLNSQPKDINKIVRKIVNDRFEDFINEEIPLDCLKEIGGTIKSKRIGKFKRFGKDEDRELFFMLKTECNYNQRDISEFFIPDCKLDSVLDTILSKVHERINFKQSKYFLLNRIRKVAANSEFSIRDKRLLKKIVTAQSAFSNFNIENIEYFFPGKSRILIKSETEKVLKEI